MIVVGGGPAGAASAMACARLGLDVLLVEGGDPDRHKPCGGVLPPVCADVIAETLGREIPLSVMCTPRDLGLFYVPPSGRDRGGIVRNYRLLNVNRDLLDRWLREAAEEEGVQVRYRTSLMDFERGEPIRVVLAKKGGRTMRAATRYLIGADGVHSTVRERLYGAEERIMHVLQEHWRAEGDLEDCFYAFFREEISPTYGYVIPKDGLLVVGVGVPPSRPNLISTRIHRFKAWLTEEFAFKPSAMVHREVWAIPHGFVCEGAGNVILVGDAAGLCNPLSGEGVRLAIMSGEAAGASVQEAITDGEPLAALYHEHIEPLAHLLRRTHDLVSSLTDEGREAFVQSELSRVSLY